MSHHRYFCIWDGWRLTPCAHRHCAENDFKKPPYNPKPRTASSWAVLAVVALIVAGVIRLVEAVT